MRKTAVHQPGSLIEAKLPVVAVLMGGPDAEREISLLSGREVAEALRRTGAYVVVELVIDRPTPQELAALGADVVFPVLHGKYGEGGPLQEAIEAAGLTYVGSEPRAAALAMDKMSTKCIMRAAGLPVVPDRLLGPDDRCDLDPPVVLKPVDDGSSVDMAICRTAGELDAARREIHGRRGSIMAEVYIVGREITVGIVNGEALPLIEIIPAAGVEFYDYQAKYFRDDTRYVVDPEMPRGVIEACRRIAMTAFRTIRCRDLARADFIVNDDGPWFLEINTMPGFTTHSLVPMAARRRGLEMPQLCARLVESALARARRAARN